MCAAIGSLLLFGLSYSMENLLTQQFVADSTELLKRERFEKSVVLAHLLFVALCLVSSCLLPRKLLDSGGTFAVMLYGCFLATNAALWFALCSLRIISVTDPFYFYIGRVSEDVSMIWTILIGSAILGSEAILWFRKRVLKQTP